TVEVRLDYGRVDAREQVSLQERQGRHGIDLAREAPLRVAHLPGRPADLLRVYCSGGCDGCLLLGLIVAVKVSEPPLIIESAYLGNCGEAVEHLTAQLVGGLDEVVQEHEKGVAFARVGGDEVVQVDLFMLTNAVNAPHALL